MRLRLLSPRHPTVAISGHCGNTSQGSQDCVRVSSYEGLRGTHSQAGSLGERQQSAQEPKQMEEQL